MYNIEFTESAEEDLRWFQKHEQETILDGIRSHLQYEPNLEIGKRKQLRPNDVAQWELRLGKFRVMYNVEERVVIVRIEMIGFKIRNMLFVRGRRREL